MGQQWFFLNLQKGMITKEWNLYEEGSESVIPISQNYTPQSRITGTKTVTYITVLWKLRESSQDNINIRDICVASRSFQMYHTYTHTHTTHTPTTLRPQIISELQKGNWGHEFLFKCLFLNWFKNTLALLGHTEVIFFCFVFF